MLPSCDRISRRCQAGAVVCRMDITSGVVKGAGCSASWCNHRGRSHLADEGKEGGKARGSQGFSDDRRLRRFHGTDELVDYMVLLSRLWMSTAGQTVRWLAMDECRPTRGLDIVSGKKCLPVLVDTKKQVRFAAFSGAPSDVHDGLRALGPPVALCCPLHMNPAQHSERRFRDPGGIGAISRGGTSLRDASSRRLGSD